MVLILQLKDLNPGCPERESLNLFIDGGFRPWLNFQPVLASLSYTQACTYNNDTIIKLLKNLILPIFHHCLKKSTQYKQNYMIDYGIKTEHC